MEPPAQTRPHATPLEEQGRTREAGRSLEWWRGWAPLLLLPGAVVLLVPPSWPRWAFMWALAFAIYASCKWLTWRRTPVQDVPLSRHAGYLLGWPGLDAAAFLNPCPC